MSEKELTQLLQEVHTELDGQGAVSDEQRELMRELMDDIRRTLGDEQTHDLGVGERLNEAVGHFQQSHPTIAFALRRVIDALARMGI